MLMIQGQNHAQFRTRGGIGQIRNEGQIEAKLEVLRAVAKNVQSVLEESQELFANQVTKNEHFSACTRSGLMGFGPKVVQA